MEVLKQVVSPHVKREAKGWLSGRCYWLAARECRYYSSPTSHSLWSQELLFLCALVGKVRLRLEAIPWSLIALPVFISPEWEAAEARTLTCVCVPGGCSQMFVKWAQCCYFCGVLYLMHSVMLLPSLWMNEELTKTPISLKLLALMYCEVENAVCRMWYLWVLQIFPPLVIVLKLFWVDWTPW